MITHEVFNQAPPRTGVDEFASNAALVDAVRVWGTRSPAARAEQRLGEAGAFVGTAEFQHDAELANTNEPVLHTHDRWGKRIDQVEYHPAYHRVIGEAVARRAHTSAWLEPGPGASVDRAAMFYLFAQVEPGHACPVSMTHAGAAILKDAEFPGRDEWWARAMSRDYGGNAALFGMAMTEKQGGSDVRANTTRATPNSDGTWSLTGHKWFCSAPMSDAFFVLAQTRQAAQTTRAARAGQGGGHGAEDQALSCFFVPRVLPDGAKNPFFIQRLKDKLGNRSNASSEIELDGTVGWLVGEPGRGVRAILPMVSRTRLDCVIGTAAGMRQSVAEAAWHARHRFAFGRALIDQPAMAAVIADLQLEAEAATLTAMRLARAHDSNTGGEQDQNSTDESDAGELAFRRLATAVAKYLVCKRGPAHAYEALECLGGNGYTEAFPLARRYREQPVLAIWEGSGNVIALDVLRALGRETAAFHAFFAEIGRARGAWDLFDTELDEVQDFVRQLRTGLLDGAQWVELRARELTERLGVLLEASLMLRYAPAAVGDAFVAARLGHPSALYGALPAGVDLPAIVGRA
ncbi:acyl-CoA dehydrogenase family protein [Gryllotalpicola reticulitermitis]|uniref:Acyl-CoA dehydrogenase family protein n=1 Tax=Gryllotalpicola reticulitermitis TaxID=1184153 RepID=A0ABV8Q9Q6_9MICO